VLSPGSLTSTPPPVPPPLFRFELLTRVMTTQAPPATRSRARRLAREREKPFRGGSVAAFPADPARDTRAGAAGLDPARRLGCC
jgi:hypothetical protein